MGSRTSCTLITVIFTVISGCVFWGCGDKEKKIDRVSKSFTSIKGGNVTVGRKQKSGRYSFVRGTFRVDQQITLRFVVLFFPTKDLAYGPPRGKDLEKLVPHGIMSVRYQDVAIVDDVYYKMKLFPGRHKELANAGYLLQHALDDAVPPKKDDGV